jgi:oxygen-independent coproporphyrinogen-3 oxidase
MEGYFEQVVETLTGAGYRGYETANFCRDGDNNGRELRARHNLGIWRGHDYLGVGIGAVSTLGGERRRNLPSLGRYVAALAGGESPPRELEVLDAETRAVELLMLGLRLDEPLRLGGLEPVVDGDALARLVERHLVERVEGVRGVDGGMRGIRLSPRGRLLGGAVTAELLAV